MTEVEKRVWTVPPPWEPADFFTDDSLKAAQEYYFQTHATHSRLIAEGRNAVGFMKSHIRRKLQREMGEDFKMYTGQEIGATQDHSVESLGIRGELNQLLAVVYQKINGGRPIESPIQEDRTILGHPLGGLEVCYALVFFYTALMGRYATLAGNRRKVLKSILDEELFKWIWRMTIAFLLSPDPAKFNFRESLLSTGVGHIPPDKQRASSAEKVQEIGHFLLSKLLADSTLRFSLVFYFVTYLRHLQFSLVSQMTGAQCEAVYKMATEHKRGEPADEILVVVDELMNTTGNSGQSFEDILKNEDVEVEKYIPPSEIEFISQFREFGRANLDSSLKKILPKGRLTDDEQGRSSLMPLLITLRTLPFDLTKIILEKVPGPLLVLFNNRLGHGADDVSRGLMELVRAVMEDRTKRGETYGLAAPTHASSRAATATTVRPRAAAAQAAPSAGGVPAKPQPAPSTGVAPAAPQPAPSTGGAAARPKPAPSAGGVPARPQPTMAAPKAAPLPPDGGPRPVTAAGEGEKPATAADLDEPVVVNWRIEGDRVAVDALSARDLLRIAGPEVRIVFLLVKFAVQTGQVFHVPPEKISREMLNEVIMSLIRRGPGDQPPLLSKEERIALIESGKSLSAKQLLASLIRKAQPASAGRLGHLEGALASLSGKLGGRLETFLRNPAAEGFREVVKGLSREEKETVSILNRVARLN